MGQLREKPERRGVGHRLHHPLRREIAQQGNPLRWVIGESPVGLGCEITPTGGLPMTDEIMSLRTLVERIPDADLLREIIGCASRSSSSRPLGALRCVERCWRQGCRAPGSCLCSTGAPGPRWQPRQRSRRKASLNDTGLADQLLFDLLQPRIGRRRASGPAPPSAARPPE